MVDSNYNKTKWDMVYDIYKTDENYPVHNKQHINTSSSLEDYLNKYFQKTKITTKKEKSHGRKKFKP